MERHAFEDLAEWQEAEVAAVYPDRWQVDARLVHSTGATVKRAQVFSHYLPEEHRTERPSKVLIGWLDAYQHAPVAIPIHRAIIPADEKPNHVFWSEHLNFRIRITRDGVMELRNLKDGRGLRVRLEEDGGVVRLDTPKISVTLHDEDEAVRIDTPNGHVHLDSAGNLAEIEMENIHLGQGAAEKVMLGSTFLAWLQAFIQVFDTHSHPDAGTNSNPAPTLPTILSDVSKTV